MAGFFCDPLLLAIDSMGFLKQLLSACRIKNLVGTHQDGGAWLNLF